MGFLILVFYEVVVGLTLDSGGGGVYDSPLVTNKLGGRSGVQGLEALQDHNDPMPHRPPGHVPQAGEEDGGAEPPCRGECEEQNSKAVFKVLGCSMRYFMSVKR